MSSEVNCFMANVFDVATYIIRYPGLNIDNLKLQKLLFYSQAVTLVKTGVELFTEEIQAWDYGPVVPVVYHKYKTNGDDYLESEDEIKGLSDIELHCIDMTMEYYGEMSGAALINLTHSENPWQEAYAKGRNTVISISSMVDFYSKVLCFN